MIDVDPAPREILLNSLPNECKENCTLAKYIINEVCRVEIGERKINISSVQTLLSKCIDGPMPVGICGTRKIACSHPSVDTTTDTQQQRKLFEESIRVL